MVFVGGGVCCGNRMSKKLTVGVEAVPAGAGGAAGVESNREKSHGSLEYVVAGTVATCDTGTWFCWSREDTACSVALVSDAGTDTEASGCATGTGLSETASPNAPLKPLSKNPLGGRLLLGGEATISPQSSSSSSSNGSTLVSIVRELETARGGSCSEDRDSGSGLGGIISLLKLDPGRLMSTDCLIT